MRSRRLGRFVLEVCFLAGLAMLATLARMHPAAVIGVLAFGWVVVALAEWSSWLDRPHFGRGVPPRYYVPQVSLPPSVPREQAALGLARPSLEAGDEQTWVVSADDWAEAFPGWPVLDVDEIGADTQIAVFEGFGPGAIDETLPGARATDAPTQFFEPDAGLDLAHGAPPEPPATVPLPARERDAQDDVAVDSVAEAGTLDQGRARHRIDPFASVGGGTLRRRRARPNGGVDVPERPPADRPLPSALRRVSSPES